MKISILFFIFLALFAVGCQKSSTPAPSLPTVGISDLTIHESDGVAPFILTLDQAPSAAQASFDIVVSDGTATAGADYTLPTVTHFIYAVGVKTQTFNIYLINDHVKRADKYFTVELKNPVGINLSGTKSTVHITNDNLIPEVNFQTGTEAVDKTTSLASIVVQLSAPAPERFSIPYTVSGTAVYGVDHQFLSGTITFNPGDTSVTLTGGLINTPGPNSNKTIVLTLQAVDGLFLGKQPTTTMLIANSLTNLVALFSGAPSGTSNLRSLNVTVVGYNVTQFKYKISATNTCASSAGYSAALPVASTINDSLSSFSDGLLYLCALGGNSSGVFQDPSIASVASWIKNTNPPLAPVLNKIDSSYYQVSAGVVLSNSATVTPEFLNLPAGYTLTLFDSATCAVGSAIGTTTVTGSPQQITGTFKNDGDHVLSAVIYDQYSQGSSCAVLLTKYTLDTAPPTVTSVSTTATAGFYKAGASIPVTVTFSKPVFVTGPATQMPYLVMNTIPTAGNATYVSSSGSQIQFVYQPVAGQNASTLDYGSQSALVPSGSTIKDLAGNSASLTLPVAASPGTISSKVSIVVDTTPPMAVLAFSDGRWGTPTQTPLFSWVQSSDPGGSGILKYQIAIGSQAGLSDVLVWTDVYTTSFQANMSLAANATYFASVRVLDRAGNISDIATADGFVIDKSPPSTPVISLSATSTFSNTTTPTFSWPQSSDDVSGLDHYEIALGTTQGANDVVDWTNLQTNNSSVLAYSGTYNKSYYASVRAFDKAGNVSTGYAQAFFLQKPIVDPNPFPVFTSQSNVPQSQTVFSNTQSIAGLSIPAGVSVSGPSGNPLISVNGGPYATSATIKNGDSIQLQMTASPYGNETFTATINFASTSTTWSISTWSCPTNYVYIPSVNGQIDFCVSKYQIHTTGPAGSEIGVSDPTQAPSLVDQTTAQRACMDNGTQYSLITNAQWQSIAQNIESTPFNWSGGAVGAGELSGGVINSSVYAGALTPSASDSNACVGATGVTCDLTAWSKYRRVMQLSTGRYLWDITGLSWQWTQGTTAYSNFSDSGSYLCPNGPTSTCFYNIANALSSFITNLFGPTGSYLNFPMNTAAGTNWGGIGQIVDPHPDTSVTGNVAIARGGAQGDEDAGYWHGGIFSGRISEGPHDQANFGVATWAAYRTTGDTAVETIPIIPSGSHGCTYPDCSDTATVAAAQTCTDPSTCGSYYYATESSAHNCSSSAFNAIGPQALAIDSAGNLYVLDPGNYRVEKFDNTGAFLLSFGSNGYSDGQFLQPTGIALDSTGNVYVLDSSSYKVQKFTATGTFISSFGSPGSQAGSFAAPKALAIDHSNNIFVLDSGSVLKFSSAGVYQSSFGGGVGQGNGDFGNPVGIVIDSGGNFFVLDSGNYRVEKFDPTGTYISQFGTMGTGTGQFENPQGIAIDSANNLYIADTYNYRIQKFTPAGNYSTQFGTIGSSNGQLRNPTGIIIDSSNNIIVSDSFNYRLEKFTSAGAYSSAFGTFGSGSSQFKGPTYTTDGSGNHYYYWSISCSTFGYTSLPASGTGAARCTYVHP